MKAAPVLRALVGRGAKQTLVHTGQHYDANMSDVFFTELGMAGPDVNLEVGSGSHATQTAEVMMRIERELIERKPDLVLVYGDVNSTMAAALVCSKLSIRVGHVEAGLRSLDRTMPEEINRVVTDQLADVLFTPSEHGDANLRREGVAGEKIHRVGNVMIDTLVRLLPAAEKMNGMPDRYALYSASAVERGFGRTPAGNSPRSATDWERCGGGVSGASADPATARRNRKGRRWRTATAGATALHRVSCAAEAGDGRDYRFGRCAGGDHVSAGAVPDTTNDHRAPR